MSVVEDTANKSSSVRRTKHRLMLVSNSAVSAKKKSRFIKNQEASRLLRNFGIRTPVSNILLNSDTLFQN